MCVFCLRGDSRSLSRAFGWSLVFRFSPFRCVNGLRRTRGPSFRMMILAV